MGDENRLIIFGILELKELIDQKVQSRLSWTKFSRLKSRLLPIITYFLGPRNGPLCFSDYCTEMVVWQDKADY